MATQSHKRCVADSSSCRHLSQVGLSVNPSLTGFLLGGSVHLTAAAVTLFRSRLWEQHLW
jgi:hypothetical protein